MSCYRPVTACHATTCVLSPLVAVAPLSSLLSSLLPCPLPPLYDTILYDIATRDMTREERTSPLLSSLRSSLLSPFISSRLSSNGTAPPDASSETLETAQRHERDRLPATLNGAAPPEASSNTLPSPIPTARRGVSSQTRAWPIPSAERPTHAHATLLFAASHCATHRRTPRQLRQRATAFREMSAPSIHKSTDSRACHDFHHASHTHARTHTRDFSERATKSSGFSCRSRFPAPATQNHALRRTWCHPFPTPATRNAL